jgi:hypothetical protein
MIRELIQARALELATHDGAPVATIVHLHGAASNLIGEIAREKDAAIADLVRSIATAAKVALSDTREPAPEASSDLVAAIPEAASPPAEPGKTPLDALPTVPAAEPALPAAAADAPAGEASAEQVPA